MQLLRPAEVRAPDEDVVVLLVEDSDAEAELAVELLREGLPGVEITRCRTLAAARAALAERRYDVALLDLGLPDGGGLDAVRTVRAGWPDLPVVVLTGDQAASRRAMAAGVQDFLVKGAVDGRSLATAVQHAVDRSRFELASAGYERLARSLLDAVDSPTCAVGPNGVIVAVNAAWQRSAAEQGVDLADSGEGTDYLALCRRVGGVPDGDVAALGRGLADVLAGRRPRFEHDYRCGAPVDRWFSARMAPLHGMRGVVVTHLDVTSVKQAEGAAQHLALHDGLTGLPNRLLLFDRLEQALAEASRRAGAVAVAFIDLDHFKRVNDTLGHAAGDRLLEAVAERLGARLRTGDTLARPSGDEFVAVWRDVSGEQEAEALAARLQEGLTEPFDAGGTAVRVTASIGVVVGRPPQTGTELLAAADAAMYDVKARGRASRRVYGADMQAQAARRSETSADLAGALARGELVLHYQPVVDLLSGDVVAVEALVRWQHPERGLLGPAAFLPVAEETGLVVPLGAHVLREACAEAARWPEGPGVGLDVAVNLSVRQVAHPEVVRTVREALESSGLAPQRLVIDVTESAVMEDAGADRSVLHDLAALGPRIAVDDFGTGWSSLQHLSRYPVGVLKLDRSFVAGLGCDAEAEAVVTSVLSLAHAVGARCVAEGVETLEQATALRLRGCELAQGNLFSPPVPAVDLSAAIDACRAAAAPLTSAGLAAEALPDPEVAARIRSLHASGASLHTIAAALNRTGAPHPAGLRWHARAVARLVGDPLDLTAAAAGGQRPGVPHPRAAQTSRQTISTSDQSP